MARFRRMTRREREEVQRAFERSIASAAQPEAARILLRSLRDVDPADVRRAVAEASRRAARAFADDVHRRSQEATRAAGRLATGVVTPAAATRVGREWLLSRAEAGWTRASETAAGWSRQLWGQQSARMAQRIGDRLESVVRGQRTVTQAAQSLRDAVNARVRISADGPGSVRIPQRITDLDRAARAMIRDVGDPESQAALRRSVARMRSRTERLVGTNRGTQGAGDTLLREVERAVSGMDAKALSDAVEWWAWKREQVHQRAVVEYETSKAWNLSYVESHASVPWVHSFEWMADAGACEDCAALDGRIIERDDLIPPPLHLHCGCMVLAVVDEEMEPTEDEWVAFEASLAA